MAMIKGNYSDSVKANIGIIASGEQLIDHHDSEIGKILNEHYNDSSAVEMEGYGFAKAASRQGSETKNIIVGVVRGISDIIELPADKQAEVSIDRRPDNAKLFASDTAAAFAFWLILKTYE
jgi:nucleoside phosphorylase